MKHQKDYSEIENMYGSVRQKKVYIPEPEPIGGMPRGDTASFYLGEKPSKRTIIREKRDPGYGIAHSVRTELDDLLNNVNKDAFLQWLSQYMSESNGNADADEQAERVWNTIEHLRDILGAAHDWHGERK